MTLVMLDEARDRLPELIALMAAGTPVVLTNGGKWVASLAAPPPTPLDEAVREARAREAIRETVRMWIAEGRELPEGHPLLKMLESEA